MHAAELAHALGAVRSGRQWKCRCVAHEDREPSMLIFDGRSAVQVRCLAGCAQEDLIGALRGRGLWEHDRWTDIERDRQPQQANISHETDARRSRSMAQSWFDRSILTAGTLAQRYLEAREIWSVARDIEDIRFNPRTWREHEVVPAIVVAMRHIREGSIEAVQRIFLTPDGAKDGKPMMLGPVRDAAMMLEPIGGFRELHIAEGLETALSVMAMDASGPVWALGSCGAIDRLVIWADHDEAGQKAADICVERWAEAGRATLIRTPNHVGWDAADVWRCRNARA
jgi:hypothetical protein